MPATQRLTALMGFATACVLSIPAALAQTPPSPAPQAAPAAYVYVPTETRAQPNMPRTPFGQPSLEGAWGSNWVVPMEASPRVPMLVAPEAVAKQIGLAVAKGVGDALDKQLDPEVPETMKAVEGLPTVLGERRTRAVVVPADGMLPYTAAAKEEMKHGNSMGDFDNPEGRPNWERCVRSLGQPPVFPIGSGNPREIVQTPSAVIIHTEYGNEARVIPYTDKHQPKMFWGLLGDSIARWEGNTLVIETVGLPDRDRIRLFPSFIVSGDSTVIERYTRLRQDELLYQFTVIDPKVYSAPWLAEYSIYPLQGHLFEHACHEGNYSLPNIMKGQRVMEERKAAAAKAATAAPSPAAPAKPVSAKQ